MYHFHRFVCGIAEEGKQLETLDLTAAFVDVFAEHSTQEVMLKKVESR